MPRKILLPLMVFVVCAAAYFALHAVHTSKAFINTTDGDEVHYLVLTESIITDNDLSPLNNYLDETFKKRDYYQLPIPTPMLIAGDGGRMVSNHLPLLSLMLAPGFEWFGYTGAAGTMILVFSLAAMFAFLALRKLVPEGIALLATLAFFLTYPAVTYSRLIYPETVMVLLLSLSLWACLRLREGGSWLFAIVAGLACALTFQLHNKFIMLIPVLMFLLLASSRRKVRDFAFWLVPVVASLVVLAWLTRYVYGPDIWHGVSASIGPHDMWGGVPYWGILGLYLDRAWGLFIFAPLYLAFLPGVPVSWKKRDFAGWWLFFPLCIIVYTLLVGIFGQWHGGVSPVPRYLVPLIPLFLVCATLFFYRSRKWWVRIVVLVLLGLQVTLTVFAVMYPMKVFPIYGKKNALLTKLVGREAVRWIAGAFPLLHPNVKFMTGVLPVLIWVFVLAVMCVLLRRRLIDPMYLGLRLDYGIDIWRTKRKDKVRRRAARAARRRGRSRLPRLPVREEGAPQART